MKSLNTVINAIYVNYYVVGKGKPLLFFHGGGTEASTYQETLEILSKKYKVYAPDMPYFGKSGSPKKPWDFTDYAKFFSKFIDKLNIRNVTIVGYSFGGGVALELTRLNKKVIKTILCSPAMINLNINRKGLIDLILREARDSFFSIRSIDEFLIFSRVFCDFVKNLILKKSYKKIIVASVLKCLNTNVSKINKKITLILSNQDVVLKNQSFKKFGLKTYHTEGTHLWFLLKHKDFEKIFNTINNL